MPSLKRVSDTYDLGIYIVGVVSKTDSPCKASVLRRYPKLPLRSPLLNKGKL